MPKEPPCGRGFRETGCPPPSPLPRNKKEKGGFAGFSPFLEGGRRRGLLGLHPLPRKKKEKGALLAFPPS